MPLLLKGRNSNLVEKMDQSNCDKDRLELTYHHFSFINPVLSGWYRIYREYIFPLIQFRSNPVSLLDVGCGGGDIPLLLQRWAMRDNMSINITAIDPDTRALNYAKSRNSTFQTNIDFREETAEELAHNGLRYDVVITNHVLHHLPDEQIISFLNLLKKLSRHYVLANDIRRSNVGYALFYLGTGLVPSFHKSFIRTDGLMSIQRSFTAGELQKLVNSIGYHVKRPYPFRLLALYEH